MTPMVPAKINGRWDLMLPEFRAEFHAERPKWEAGRLEHMAEVIRPGMTVFDVGAEHGDFTALYRMWAGASGTVVPIEPSTAYWPCIRETWDANVPSDPEPVYGPPAASFVGFASDRGEARFGLHQGAWPDEVAGDVQADPGFRHLNSQSETIPQIRLDTLAWRTRIFPDAVVIDVEGAEWHVLSGMARLFTTAPTPPHVWVSVHDVGVEFTSLHDWYGKSLWDIRRLMAGHGYDDMELPANGEGEHFWYFAP